MILPLLFGIILLGGAAWQMWVSDRAEPSRILWCAAWGFLFLFYWIFGQDYVYRPWVSVYLFGCVAVFMLGHIGAEVALHRSLDHVPMPKIRNAEITFLRPMIAASIAIGFIGTIRTAQVLGFSPSSILHLHNYLAAMRDNHAQLSTGQAEEDTVAKLCLMFPFAMLMVTGLYAGLGRVKTRLEWALMLAPIIPYVAITAITTLRSFVLIPAIVFAAAFITGQTVRGLERRMFGLIPVLGTLAATLVLSFGIIGLESIRSGDYQFRAFGKTADHMRPWIAGYVPALDMWLYHDWDGSHKMGVTSFRGVTSLLGVKGQGIDTKMVAEGLGKGEDSSNAMTYARSTISDFGEKGTILFTLIWGLLSGLIAYLMRRRNYVAAVLYAGNLATIIFAPNGWFLGYGTRLLSCFVAAAIVAICLKDVVKARDTTWQELGQKAKPAGFGWFIGRVGR